jgi:hypothetical protein
MSSSSSSYDPDIVKALGSAGVAFALDKFYMGQQDMQKSAMFAAAVGVGNYTSSYLINNDVIPIVLPDMGTFANGVAVQARIQEIALGAGASYALNRFVFKQTVSNNEFMKQIGIVIAADLGGEIIKDYMVGDSINVLK